MYLPTSWMERRACGALSDVVRSPQVDMVLLPSTSGDFGVMPGHVPTVAQLRPGVVTVHTELDKQARTAPPLPRAHGIPPVASLVPCS